MRLDHLLSKEHWHLLLRPLVGGGFGCPGGPSTGERPVGVAQGWNIDLAPSPRAGSPVLAFPVFGWGGRGPWAGVGVGVPGTLLGPEGSEALQLLFLS